MAIFADPNQPATSREAIESILNDPAGAAKRAQAALARAQGLRFAGRRQAYAEVY